MPKYFIGNILSPTETQPEAHDPTFAFTREETEALDMEGVPIRMEHHPDMEVGTIKRAWTDADGRKWVLGSLNDDGMQSRFAKYAIDKNGTGTAYYTGLSLQHTHTQYASGKSKKTPIEVSLCVNPRRGDCRIAFVDSELNHDQTEKVTYKILQHASNKMASETPVEQPQETTPPESAAPVEQQKNEESTEMSREEMMQVIIQQQKELEEKQTNKTKEQEELEQLKSLLQKQKDEEAAKTLAAAKALSEDLVNQWAQSLDKTEMTEENKESIMKMARDFPEQSMQLLRVAHCASRHHAAQVEKFEEFKKMSEKMQLQEKFEAVMQKKRPRVERAEPVAQQVHAASTKKQKKNAENMALSIIKQYRASGSARDHMSALSEYQAPKRRRAPYY